MPQPSYPLFDFLADLDDVRVRPAPLVYDHGWQIDVEGFRRAITPQTRAIMLVHPNNPTGHFTKPWEQQELARLCLQHDLSLIVDEVFLDYPFGVEERSFAPGLDGVPVFVVSGLSKIAGLPQMKAAWILATGPACSEAMNRLEVIADTFLSMNAPVQWALPAWLAGREQIQCQIRTRVSANLAELDTQLGKQGMIDRLQVEGGWYAIAAHSCATARRADGTRVAGTRSLGAPRLLFRYGRLRLAGAEFARPGGRVPPGSNHVS